MGKPRNKTYALVILKNGSVRFCTTIAEASKYNDIQKCILNPTPVQIKKYSKLNYYFNLGLGNPRLVGNRYLYWFIVASLISVIIGVVSIYG